MSNFSDLLNVGASKAGCTVAQDNRRDGAPPLVRFVQWTDEVPSYLLGVEPGTLHIAYIWEEPAPGDMPDALALAFAGVLDEILSTPVLAARWQPGDFVKATRRVMTAASLKTATTEEDFAKALRAQSRLGPWLQPA